MGTLNREMAINALSQVIDLELGIDIVTLGLIYDVRVNEQKDIDVDMTLTTPACPLAGIMVEQAKTELEKLDGVGSVNVNLVFDPPWTPERMDSSIRNHMGL